MGKEVAENFPREKQLWLLEHKKEVEGAGARRRCNWVLTIPF